MSISTKSARMKRLVKTATLASVLTVTMVTGSGCIFLLGAAGGAAGAAYVANRVKSVDSVSLQRAHDAAVKALEELKMPIVKRMKTATSKTLQATTADGKDVNIQLTTLTPDTTEVLIQVGLAGDKDRANIILAKMKAHY